MIEYVLLTIGLLAVGIGISEYYHWRMGKAARSIQPMDQPDLWDLTPPTPQPRQVVNAEDYAHMRKTGRVTKFVGGGRV